MIWLILIAVIIGALAGWLAGVVMKSKRSFLWNVILGIAGGFVGSFIAGLVGIGGDGWIISILIGAGGACLLIIVGRALGLTK